MSLPDEVVWFMNTSVLLSLCVSLAGLAFNCALWGFFAGGAVDSRWNSLGLKPLVSRCGRGVLTECLDGLQDVYIGEG
ncbi:hypothetical protein FRC12_018792 [Ceratobasidium sp. 428]|nr:hypothetical protein FRC12_018792 [Ceratobasidium sp. 428]